MKAASSKAIWLAGALASCNWSGGAALAQQPAPGLVWDAEQKEISLQPGELAAHFVFAFTNVSDKEIVVNSVHPSCGCTTVKLPPLPWKLAAGTNGQIDAVVDLRGKSGLLMKSVSIESSAGTKHLILKINMPGQPTPGPDLARRVRNQQMAMADRQAVFKNDCATCHAHPAAGKLGQELFQTACAVCHDTPNRATMVPDLYALNKPTDAEYWNTWVAHGKPGTLMPAFAQAEGGPLSEAQIVSLAHCLSQKPLHRPVASQSARPAAPVE